MEDQCHNFDVCDAQLFLILFRENKLLIYGSWSVPGQVIIKRRTTTMFFMRCTILYGDAFWRKKKSETDCRLNMIFCLKKLRRSKFYDILF